MVSLIKEHLGNNIFTKKKKEYKIYNKDELVEVMEKNFKHKIFKTRENIHSILVFYLMDTAENFSLEEETEESIDTLLDLVSDHIRKDDKVVKIGKRDFLILLPNTQLQQAEIVLKRVRQIIMDFFIKREIEICPYYKMIKFTPYTSEESLLRKIFVKQDRAA